MRTHPRTHDRERAPPAAQRAASSRWHCPDAIRPPLNSATPARAHLPPRRPRPHRRAASAACVAARARACPWPARGPLRPAPTFSPAQPTAASEPESGPRARPFSPRAPRPRHGSQCGGPDPRPPPRCTHKVEEPADRGLLVHLQERIEVPARRAAGRRAACVQTPPRWLCSAPPAGRNGARADGARPPRRRHGELILCALRAHGHVEGLEVPPQRRSLQRRAPASAAARAPAAAASGHTRRDPLARSPARGTLHLAKSTFTCRGYFTPRTVGKKCVAALFASAAAASAIAVDATATRTQTPSRAQRSLSGGLGHVTTYSHVTVFGPTPTRRGGRPRMHAPRQSHA